MAVDWTKAQRKAALTARWAVTMTKVRIRHVLARTRWQLVTFYDPASATATLAEDCGMWPRRVPSNIRKRLSRERLPQMLHTSCGLLLMVSQPAQNTALSRGTALKPPSIRAPAFISEPLYREMLTRHVTAFH